MRKMTMRTYLIALSTVFSGSVYAATTGWNPTAGGTYNYSDSANWVDGVINNVWDSSLVLAADQTITFSGDTTIAGDLNFTYAGTKNIIFTSGTGTAQTLSLGGNINIIAGSSQTTMLGNSGSTNDLNLDLGTTNHNFKVGTSRVLAIYDVVSGSGGINISGGGTVNFYGNNNFTGSINASAGVLGFVNAGSASSSAVSMTGGTITFNNTGATPAGPLTRVASAKLTGANLNVTGVSGANTTDVIAGSLTSDRGHSIVTITANAAKNAALQADSFNYNPGATTLFRGTNLGVNSIASKTAGSTNIIFTNAPTMVGGGGAVGTTTRSVIKAAYGDTTTSGNGSGLVTYDLAYGVRMLLASEYTSSITSGQTTLDNVRLQNSSGSTLTQTINDNTTIGSLSIGVSSTTGSGVTIDGTGTLTIASGMLYANQSISTPASGDAMIIRGPKISFDNQDAYIITLTNGVKNGVTAGPLQIDSEITGAASLTKADAGVLKLGGSTANTYTGTTYVNAGVLHLAKTGITNSTIVGDIVVNGGTLFCGSNQIADTSNVTINGGTWTLRSGATNSGSSTSETVNDLIMTGGSVGAGAANNSGALSVHHADLSGGTLSVSNYYSLNISGDLSLSGGIISLSRSNNAATYSSYANITGDTTITNTDASAYTAITMTVGDSTHLGSRIGLGGDLTFIGNSANTNTVTIGHADGTDTTYMGVIDLKGAQRTFNIGNGAANVDLSINAGIINGSLIKTGAGTLAFNGNNTYTGLTTIAQGILSINANHAGNISVTGGTLSGTGNISGSVTVDSGGTLAAGNSVGTLTVGALTLNSGSSLQFEFDSTGNDLVIVSGSDALTILGGNISLLIADGLTLDGAYHLIQYSGSLSGDLNSLSLTNSGYQLATSTDGTYNYIDIQTASIPEPAALLTLATGASALLLRRSRRA